MKKVININFQGRVIPIEESAYELLQGYIGSLREYFNREEGRDEIIYDIENRIAELFSETLKKGAACITDADVDRISRNIGRPSDFAAAEEETPGTNYSEAPSGSSTGSGFTGLGSNPGVAGAKRLYRDERDKLLGGVASGLAHYFNIDPAIMRLVFILLTVFGGSGILIYIVLWIVLPSTGLVTNVRKRLFRNPDDRIIGGVCGGLSHYFDINPVIPRVIFAAPFIVSIITSIGRNLFDNDFVAVGAGGGFTFILAYVILWIILPEARTTAEKLEMRGEPVDINTIRDSVMGDLQNLKGRAQQAGSEMLQQARTVGSELGQNFGDATAQVAGDVRQAATRRRSGLGNAIAILFKAFIYLIGGAIAIGLFIGLITLLASGVSIMPFRDFFLEGEWQYLMAWGCVLLFLGIPMVAVLLWIIRRMAGIRSGNKFLTYGFVVLWLLGLFCILGLAGSINRSISSQVGKQEDITLPQPQDGKLYIGLQPNNLMYAEPWLDMEGAVGIDGDTLHLNTVRLSVVKSRDTSFHLHLMKISRGNSRERAQQLAERIEFNPIVQGNRLLLPETFAVTKDSKWRNQKVVVLVEVPVGKKLEIDDAVEDNYEYFSIDFGRRRSWRIDWNRDWEETLYWTTNREMLMTEDGLTWKKNDENNESAPFQNEEPGSDWNNNAAPAQPDTPSVGPKPNVQPPAAPATTDTAAKRTVATGGSISTGFSPLTLMIRGL